MNRSVLYLLSFCLLLAGIYSCSKDDSSNGSVANNTLDFCISYSEDGGLVNFKLNCLRENDMLRWDFGDSSTSTDTAPTHVYENPGRYTVSLEINRNNELIENGSVQLEIIEVCKTCECYDMINPGPFTFSFCGTGIKAEDFCINDCDAKTNQVQECFCS